MTRSDYERARRYLEEQRDQHRTMTAEEFKERYFNEPLYKAKGEDWTRAGLLVGPLKPQAPRAPAQPQHKEEKAVKRRFSFVRDRRGQWHKRDRRGHFARFTRHDRKRLGIPSQRVKKKQPSRPIKGGSNGNRVVKR